jgi:hypothetical protein
MLAAQCACLRFLPGLYVAILRFRNPISSAALCELAGLEEVPSFRRKHVVNQNRTILNLQQSCDEAIPYFMERMKKAGLYVIRTFNLHETRLDDLACTCPHHGTEKCDCQMVVLMVYGKDNQPASLVVHGHNGQTWFSLVEFLGSTNPHLEAQICNILTPSEIEQTARGLS